MAAKVHFCWHFDNGPITTRVICKSDNQEQGCGNCQQEKTEAYGAR